MARNTNATSMSDEPAVVELPVTMTAPERRSKGDAFISNL